MYRRRWRKVCRRFPVSCRDSDTFKDLTRIHRLTARNRGWTLFGFSPQLAVVREARESNAPLRDYRKTRLELLFHREF